MKKRLSALTSLAVSLCFSLSAYAQPNELAETISETAATWGTHTVQYEAIKELSDPSVMPEYEKMFVDGIHQTDLMLGLAFRVTGEIPQKIGELNVHYFNDYHPYDAEKHDAFSKDKDGIFLASYAYYQDYCKNRFYIDYVITRGEKENLQSVGGDAVALSNTDAIVILMMEFPEAIQEEARESYYLQAEKALRTDPQFEYVGEARKIKYVFFWDYMSLDITCKDADSAEAVLHSDLLSEYSNKTLSGFDSSTISVQDLFPEEARKLRTAVRQDERVVSAQIPRSETGEGLFCCGFFSSITPGDLNNDGSLTIADAVLLARVAAEDETLKATAAMQSAADYDQSGEIDSDDIIALLKTLANT